MMMFFCLDCFVMHTHTDKGGKDISLVGNFQLLHALYQYSEINFENQ